MTKYRTIPNYRDQLLHWYNTRRSATVNYNTRRSYPNTIRQEAVAAFNLGRARGNTKTAMSQTLGVPRSTLFDWNNRYVPTNGVTETTVKAIADYRKNRNPKVLRMLETRYALKPDQAAKILNIDINV